MTAITCARCSRRFTPTIEVIQAALAAGQGQKHTQIICPHCGKGNKVALARLQSAVRPIPPTVAPSAPAEAPAPAAAPEPQDKEPQEA